MGKLIKFAYVNEHADFPALLAHYNLEYTRTADQLRLRCPFHDDRTPSLSITLVPTETAGANTWYCFGCNNSGSIIDFAARIDGTDLRTAAGLIASISNCALAPPKTGRGKRSDAKTGTGPESPGAGRGARSRAKDGDAPEKPVPGNCGAPEARSDGNPPLRFALKTVQEHPYLADRASSEAIELFELGYVPEDSKSIMAGRIAIPIHNLAGELIAYAGRVAADGVPDGVEKYRLPPNFTKSAVLFNAHRVGETEDVVVVEGFFGAIRLHMLGAPVVALMGTSVSAVQIALLREMGIRRVLVVLDADAPGRKARPGLVDALARSFFVAVRDLPDGCDPGDADEEALHDLATAFA